eukprot:EG_transcript_9794
MACLLELAAAHATVFLFALAGAYYVLCLLRRFHPGCGMLIFSTPVLLLNFLLPVLFHRATAGGSSEVTCLYVCLLSWLANLKVLAMCGGRGPLPGCTRYWTCAAALLLPPCLSCPEHKLGAAGSQTAVPSSPLQSRLAHTALHVAVLLVWGVTLNVFPGVASSLLLMVVVYAQSSIPYNCMAVAAQLAAGLEVADVMRRPWRASSLTSFWQRWNLMAAYPLRWAIYEPIVDGPVAGKDHPEGRRRGPWRMLGVLATFVVNGLYHEYMLWVSAGHLTGEWLAFFVIMGLAVCGEDALKAVWRRHRLPAVPRLIPTMVTYAFLVGLAWWLFLPSYAAVGWAETTARGLAPFMRVSAAS